MIKEIMAGRKTLIGEPDFNFRICDMIYVFNSCFILYFIIYALCKYTTIHTLLSRILTFIFYKYLYLMVYSKKTLGDLNKNMELTIYMSLENWQ